MHILRRLIPFASLICVLLLVGCQRTSQDAWEDTKTCSRHMWRGICALGGNANDSRAVWSKDEFAGYEYYGSDAVGEDFIPLPDQDYGADIAMGDYSAVQPSQSPGEPGSSVPGIDSFRDPSTQSKWSGVFRNIYFEYNSNLIKGQDNLNTLHNIADYLRQHPQTYIFVEGHCDERGPEAYNLALGARRSNAVRNLLIQEGAHPDQIFTISYGKERPLFFEHSDEAWSKNRRAEFKVYER